jgi:hypothetical protein
MRKVLVLVSIIFLAIAIISFVASRIVRGKNR